jgi:CDP-paratose 2-epimerase
VDRNLEVLLRQNQITGGERCTFLDGDITDFASVQAAVVQADAVFHFAAQTSVTSSLADPFNDFEVNARGTLNVVEAIRQRRDREKLRMPLVFTSTSKVYGVIEDLQFIASGDRYAPVHDIVGEFGIPEECPLDFRWPTGISKGCADQYVQDYARNYDLPLVSLRLSSVYGPYQYATEDQGWLTHFLLKARRGEPITIFGDGRQVRDVLWVDDLVDALELALKHAMRLGGSTFNVGGGPLNTVSLLEALEHLESAGLHRPPVFHDEWRRFDPKFYVSDIRRFREATGWTPHTTVRVGIGKLARWVEENSELYEPRKLRKALPKETMKMAIGE